MEVREIPISALALAYVVVDTSSPPYIPPGYAGPATFESEGSWQRSLDIFCTPSTSDCSSLETAARHANIIRDQWQRSSTGTLSPFGSCRKEMASQTMRRQNSRTHTPASPPAALSGIEQPATCCAKSADAEARFYHASRWCDEPKAAEHSVKPTPVVSELVSNANEVRSNQAVSRAEHDSADGAAERQVGLFETWKATQRIAAPPALPPSLPPSLPHSHSHSFTLSRARALSL